MQNKQIIIKGANRTEDILKCESVRNAYFITFKDGKSYHYSRKDVKIIVMDKNQLEVNSKLEYFKELANQIGLKIKNEKGQTINILANNYQTITEVSPKSILHNYLMQYLPLEKKIEKDTFGSLFKFIRTKDTKLEDTTIYPFGFNISQNEATEKAINNKLSVIEGPPGTGKTQTILNILANAIMRNETVAVVSSNNSATKNIIDKLKKYNIDFIAAYLGNNQNKQEFINSQLPLPNIEEWLLEQEEIEKIYKDIKNLYSSLKNMLSAQKDLSALKQKLFALEIEQKHYQKYLEEFEVQEIPNEIKKLKSWKKAIELSLILETEPEELEKQNPIIKFLIIIIEYLKIKKFNKTIAQELLNKYPKNYLIALTQYKFYEIQIKELTSFVNNLAKQLEHFNFNEKMSEYSELSAKLFKTKLAEKYSKHNRKVWKLTDLKTNANDFIEDYPVILSTTYSLRNCLDSSVMYDYVIVDEASQVDLCTGAIALSCARKAVIVGDLKQLPNVIDSYSAKISDKIFKNYSLNESFRYKDNCLLSSIVKVFPQVEKTLLREHYRCHPMIIEFCNKKFYNNELIILSEIKSNRKPLIVYKTVAGNLATNNLNQRQIDVIKEEIIPNENLCVEDDSLGIVTPYRNQTNALQSQFKGTNVKADTVDKFQGQENRVIILSTVDNVIKDFTDNPNRLNVAVSRAIEQLIVIINGNKEQNDSNIADLVNYIEYNNCEIKESKLFSIFDYLYKCYAEQRIEFLKKCKKISQYDSENLFYDLLTNKVLKPTYGNKYDVVIHIPLNKIIKDLENLNQDETDFVQNSWSHVDFLIYNSLTKTPVVAIEVDGAAYHLQDSKQAKRDILKNNIFKKYDLPLLRFSTKDNVNNKTVLNAIEKYLN